jgi:site-specific DNA recombinase
LEAAVWSDVCLLLQDPGRLRRELERRLERPPDAEWDAVHLRESIAKLKRRLARLIDAYENDWLDKHEFEARMGRAKEHLARQEEAYAGLEQESKSDDELRLVITQFQAFAEQIAAGLEHADFATRRKLLRLLIKHIEIDDDEVRIVYKVQPHPFVLRPVRGDLQDCLKFHSKAQRRGASPRTLGSRPHPPERQWRSTPLRREWDAVRAGVRPALAQDSIAKKSPCGCAHRQEPLRAF